MLPAWSAPAPAGKDCPPAAWEGNISWAPQAVAKLLKDADYRSSCFVLLAAASAVHLEESFPWFVLDHLARGAAGTLLKAPRSGWGGNGGRDKQNSCSCEGRVDKADERLSTQAQTHASDSHTHASADSQFIVKVRRKQVCDGGTFASTPTDIHQARQPRPANAAGRAFDGMRRDVDQSDAAK